MLRSINHVAYPESLMPFTPFHLGPALVAKASVPRAFSLVVFAGSQVLIDLEPLIRMLRGDRVLHGFSHTIGGATLVGLCAAVLMRPIVNWVFPKFLADPQPALITWIRGPETISWAVALGSAMTGTYSHLIFDGLMHADMHPFRPFSDANPLLGLVSVGDVYLGCVVAGAIGVALFGLGFGARELRDRGRKA
jgi:membrane-bound metal-dependent hydrolase YbcI (DUF457 family)